ncbi:MAG: hypothetical protein DRQ44_10075 [Gammaproteobacteria bacterium]|nr:MAG: hypothetical protein DRQ44_10075 [Gammaproteobacteria bacterium]
MEQFSACPSLDITASPSWLLAEYRPSMDIKKATVLAVAFWDSFFYIIYCNDEKPNGQRVRFQ